MTPAEYTRLEFRARKEIDRATFNRLAVETTQRNAVRMLMFDLISLYQDDAARKDAALTGAVSGWSNDGVSLNAKQAAPLTQEELDIQTSALIDDYLMNEKSIYGTALLYTGVPVCP